jgi:hypothetical protein
MQALEIFAYPKTQRNFRYSVYSSVYSLYSYKSTDTDSRGVSGS